jgi:HPt (histidine-containing phosphotransfer) domain-containing protein
MTHEKDVISAAGMDDFIAKPVDTAAFYRTLAKWIPAARQRPPAPAPLIGALPTAATLPTALPTVAGIDTAAGLQRFAGNVTRYRHWLAAFAADAGAGVEAIAAQLAAGEREPARQAAHAFKGRVGMLGMVDLQQRFDALERALLAATPGATPETDHLPGIAAAVAAISAELPPLLADHAIVPSAGDAGVPAAGIHAPPTLAQLLDLLERCDGGSAAALEACIVELRDSAWLQPLTIALKYAQEFEFEAARQLLLRHATTNDPEAIS